MRALIAFSHADPQSLTHAVAGRIADAIRAADPGNEAELADLASEGFDPRFGAADLAHFRREAQPPADILAEQARIDRADALVLVFPIYWWSMPGQLKGWIDRVFVNGWAYDELADGTLRRMLQRLDVHVVAIGAADDGVYGRHGYAEAMRTQIDHGIFGYCGASLRGSHRLLPVADAPFPAAALERAQEIGRAVGRSAAQESAAA